MRSQPEIRNTLENLPLYNEEIEKSNKNISNSKFLSVLPFFPMEAKKLTHKQLSELLPFAPQKTKTHKKLTKRQILEKILPLYQYVNIFKKEYSKKYAENYDVEVMDTTSLDNSLSLARSSINDFFRDFIEEKRRFKYNLKSKVIVRKWNSSTNTNDYHPAHLMSNVITVTTKRFYLSKAYEEKKNTLEIQTSHGSGWIIDEVDNISIEISNFEPLAASSYIPLPQELNNSMKGLINIFNKNDNECFKWCHIRLLYPRKKDASRITKEDKDLVKTLDYSGITFPMNATHYDIVGERFNVNVNVFIYDNNRIRPARISIKSNNQELNTLIITNEEGKAHYVFIRDFNRLMFSSVKSKNNKKDMLVCIVYNVLLSNVY